METKKLDFIDALRGWAVLGVILAHIPWPGTLGYLSSFVGGKGVQLFYVLSAFTLFRSHSRRIHEERHPVRNFFIRRFFRIAPMFYLAAVTFLLVNGTGPSYWAPDGLSWWHILTTFTFTNGWHPETINTIVFGGWSVADEEGFYASFILLYYLALRPRSAVLMTVVFLVGGVFLSEWVTAFWHSYYGGSPKYAGIVGYFGELWLPAQAAVFALGLCFFHLWKEVRPEGDTLRNSLSLALLSLFVAGAFLVPYAPRLRFLPPAFVYGLLFVAFSYALVLRPWKLFVNGAMIRVGRASFSIYLLHSFGIRAGSYVAESAGVGADTFWGAWIVLAVTLPLAIGGSFLTYAWIELRFIDLARRLIERLESRDNVPTRAQAAGKVTS